MPALQTTLYTHILPSGLVLFQLVVYVLQFLMASFAMRLSHSFFLTSHVKHAHAPKTRGERRDGAALFRGLYSFSLLELKPHEGATAESDTCTLTKLPKAAVPQKDQLASLWLPHSTSGFILLNFLLFLLVDCNFASH